MNLTSLFDSAKGKYGESIASSAAERSVGAYNAAVYEGATKKTAERVQAKAFRDAIKEYVRERSRNPRGKVPTALAKYWATHKRKRKANPKAKKRRKYINAEETKHLFGGMDGRNKVVMSRKYKSHTPPRKKNPRASYHLALKTPTGSRLYYAGGDKFSNVKKAASFASIDAVKIVARRLLLIYPSLRKYPVLAVPA